MTKRVYGVAINDCKQTRKDGKKCPYYAVWENMIKRSYSSFYESYKDVRVCNEWLTFSNFKAWMEQQDWEGKHLDKDLLGDGTLYSPETCCFLPPEVNRFLIDCGKGQFVGVFKHRHGLFRAACSDPFLKKSVHLGVFHSKEDAHLAWKSYKNMLASFYAEKITDSRVKECLLEKYSHSESLVWAGSSN